MAVHNIKFSDSKSDQFELKYNTLFVNRFNKNLNLTQTFLDKKVGTNLQKYVSYKTGTQEKSIPNANTYGKGYVKINVPYAKVQAYSNRIKKRVGLRGTRPFERMCADKKSTIINEVNEYSRRING